jgi:hypothetical protein
MRATGTKNRRAWGVLMAPFLYTRHWPLARLTPPLAASEGTRTTNPRAFSRGNEEARLADTSITNGRCSWSQAGASFIIASAALPHQLKELLIVSCNSQ